MPTEKPRFTITVDPDLNAAIDNYKFKTRSKNQTQAVVSLIEKGLSAIENSSVVETKKSPAPEGTRDKEHILLDETNDLLVELGYIQKGQQLSDADLAFLEHWIGLLDAWFRGK